MKKENLFPILIVFVFLFSCQKEIKNPVQQQKPEFAVARNDEYNGHLKQANTYSADVVIAWINMQIRLMSTTPGLNNTQLGRMYAYSGIALYESVVAGMPAYQSVAPQLNGLSGLPSTQPGFAYHWPSSANAALAFMNKHMFPTTSAANKAAIDSLENALNIEYRAETDTDIINRSVTFGRDVAQQVFNWSESDGYLHASDPYTPPIGVGLWVPTPPAFAKASVPYWGNLRTIVAGSGDNAQPGPPISYSTDPSSDFYNMVKQVYDFSLTLTPEQTAMALFWRDQPGVSSPGHWESILMQVLEKENTTLDKAAIAYELCGIALNDADISCWEAKYHYNLVRPITYIRTVMGHPTWSSLLNTPPHPEYPSAHAILSSATADAMTNVFGDNYNITDHTYDYLGFAPRSYTSFRAIGEDAGNSRIFAGIHYQPSIDTGFNVGRKVAQNIISKLKFLK